MYWFTFLLYDYVKGLLKSWFQRETFMVGYDLYTLERNEFIKEKAANEGIVIKVSYPNVPVFVVETTRHKIQEFTKKYSMYYYKVEAIGYKGG